MRFWLGGYTADMSGHASGIGVLVAGEPAAQSPRGALTFSGTAVHAESPSWLVAHPTEDVVYATLEERGAVQAFRRTGDDTLAPLGAPVSTGYATCHAAIAPGAGTLVTAAYGDGTITRVALAADGSLGVATALSSTTDPYSFEAANPPASLAANGTVDLSAAAAALREAAGPEFAHLVPDYDNPEPVETLPVVEDPNARVSRGHHTTFVSGGLFATTDLGFDLVRIWRGDTEIQQVALPKGSGPRHAVWHPSGHLYVVTEYSGEVYGLAPDREGVWRIVTAVPVSRETSFGVDYPAEISTTIDGLYLHVTVRGSNTVATIAVLDGGARLESVALVESGVDWPRHHVLVGDTIFVTGQRSDDVVSRSVDPRTGIVGQLLHRTPAPTPTALVPLFD
ncbi:lactonase family protein [Microbacterium sp. YY-03]|uniref:lactonase family protein n=1 Tax=Microbacterium sp. YY-03 TaxID=3421636 RepID=UPI003D1857CF